MDVGGPLFGDVHLVDVVDLGGTSEHKSYWNAL
jgi:hypothetical protein